MNTLAENMKTIQPLTAEEIKEKLRDHVVDLTFIKKDGTIRRMKATLNEYAIPKSAQPKGTRGKTQAEVDGLNIKVYDTEAEGWRTVVVDKIVSIY